MAEIYARCTSVLIWLGLPGPHSRPGLEIMAFLVRSDTRIDSGDAPWDQLHSSKVEAALRDILER